MKRIAIKTGPILLATLLGMAGCAGSPQFDGGEENVEDIDEDLVVEQRVSLGHYNAHVDMSDPDNPQITFTSLAGSELDQAERANGTPIAMPAVSVLTDVSLYGPGTWNASTSTLSADVRITNTGTQDYNEPTMEVLSCTDDTVVFQLIHGGGGGVGSWWGYADIEEPPGANDSSAHQLIELYAPEENNFDFSLDILATLGSLSSEIYPDADDDIYNEEDLAEAAGGDCDDDSAYHYPGGQDCLPELCISDSTLRACYELDSDVNDDSGNGNDATTVDNTSFALGIDGPGMWYQSSSHVRVEDDNSINPTRLSIDMWIYPSQMPTGSARMGLLEKNNEYGMYMHSGGQIRCLWGLQNGLAQATGYGVNEDQWNHVACTYDGTRLRLYINGSYVSQDYEPGQVRTGSGYVLIGEEAPGGGDQFIGGMDRLRIWSTALSSTFVAESAGQ